VQEVLAGAVVGVISAHPDDHLIQVHGIQMAHAMDAEVRELTITRGKDSTLNYHPDPNFVLNGGRPVEGEAAAHRMGILSNDHLDGPDGDLVNHRDEHVLDVAEWIAHHGINVLMTLGGLTDHPDHTASAAMGRQASELLWDAEAYAVNILEIQQADTGYWEARATSEGQATAFAAAREHMSQMMIARTVQPGWVEVPGGFWVHPDTLRGLDQYPIRRSATYSLIATGQRIRRMTPATPRRMPRGAVRYTKDSKRRP